MDRLWDGLGYAICVAILIGIAGAICITTFADHEVKDYYLKSNSYKGNISYSIWEDRAYFVDSVAYIATDKEDAKSSLERLQATLDK